MKKCPKGCTCKRHTNPDEVIAANTIVSDGCWFWRKRSGEIYQQRPAIAVAGKKVLVSRYLLERSKGRPLADGMEGCHSCDDGRCVRPDHLFEGTHQENMADAQKKGRIKQTTSSRRRIGAAQRGISESDETRAKLSQAHTGIPLSAEHRAAIGRGGRGIKKPFSDAHRQALSLAQRRRFARQAGVSQ